MFIAVSLLVCIVGLFIYFAAKTNAEVKHVGEIMFFCGLLAFLLTFAGSAWFHFLVKAGG